MPLNPDEREALIAKYAAGPGRLREAISAVPAAARQFRPAPGKWSAHEIVVHCADSETNAAARIRYVLAEKDPVVSATTRPSGPASSTTTRTRSTSRCPRSSSSARTRSS